ncbi:unnamed protein product [Amoebophrya sp. A120]|nr:unnamed protein product [Amoebophrya sp. A120]|eukprot:GSA120T00000273001.1
MFAIGFFFSSSSGLHLLLQTAAQKRKQQATPNSRTRKPTAPERDEAARYLSGHRAAEMSIDPDIDYFSNRDCRFINIVSRFKVQTHKYSDSSELQSAAFVEESQIARV